MKAIKFVLLTLCGLLGVLYLSIIVYVYCNQDSMIFQSQKLQQDYKFNYLNPFEEINTKVADDVFLNGLLFKANNPKGLVFYLHGNAGTLETWGNFAEEYTRLGYDIFILDYRGFGKSGGSIDNEAQFYNDINTVYKTMLNKYDESKVIIVGYSIGTGGAAYLASKNKPKALILQAPYYNFSELSDTRVPFIPEFIKKYKFETNTFITKIKCPIYIFHGDKDQVIVYENSVRLAKLLKKGDHFFTLKNQDHLNMNNNGVYLSELKNILH